MKYEILKLLQEETTYISGESMSEKLGISRSAVWKHIGALRRDGYKISSVPSKGYILDYAPDRINPDELKASVPGRVYYFSETASTNAEAKREENVPDKSLFIAEAQTAGRGRLGRKWSSPKGSGIWMSLYLEPQIPAASVSQLTLIAGLAVSRAIEGSSIKWPNDVLLEGRKVSGILTEMTAEMDRVSRVIVGIGINVNNEVFGIDLLLKANSLYLSTGRKHDRTQLTKAVLEEFWQLYDRYTAEGFSSLRREYIKKCATLSREVVLIRDGEELVAKAIDISENGGLIVNHNGRRLEVSSGEVSVRGLLGYN